MMKRTGFLLCAFTGAFWQLGAATAAPRSCVELSSALGDAAPRALVQAAVSARSTHYSRVSSELREAGVLLDRALLEPDSRFLRSTPAAASGTGFVSNNRWFYDEILRKAVLKNRAALEKLPLRRRISSLLLLIHTSYDAHFGQSDLPGHFYRWGGDLFDNDAPVINDIRTAEAFGLDCSGFVASAFDVAIKENLLTPQELAAHPFLRSRQEQLAQMVPGIPSPHRLNVKDFARIGREIAPSEAQAGDYIVIPKAEGVFPHIVAIVEIEGKLHIAESANNGSITRDHILQAGRYLRLEEGLERLKQRGVAHSLRSVLSP
jgi:hypothetical protein